MQTENTYVETDLGNIALNPRGEYSSEASYEYLDTVSYMGGSYVCLAELTKTISGIAPAQGKNTDMWQMIASPGDLTPEYIALHDEVINKAKQVETSRAATELSQQEVEAAQADVQQMRQDTQEASQMAIASRDSAAGYAQSAEMSRTAAKESEDNINAQVTGFDAHVAEKTSETESAIVEARQTAVDAVSTKQNDATQAVTDEGDKQIKNVEDAGVEQVGKVKSAGASAVSAAGTAGQTAINAIKTQQTASVKAVTDEGTQQVTDVNTAGSTQVSTIETEGADQVKAIQEAGENALQNISNGVDKGLSEEGKAADAKATGEAISNLTEDLDEIGSILGYEKIDKSIVGTVIKNEAIDVRDGSIKQFDRANRTDFIDVSDRRFKYYYTGYIYNIIGIAGYDADNKFVSVILGGTTTAEKYDNYELTIPTNVSKIRASSFSNSATIDSVLNIQEVGQINELTPELDDIRDEINVFKNRAVNYLYVSSTGDDENGIGSFENPFKSIYKANESIKDNSEKNRYIIKVLDGTYTDLQEKYAGSASGKYEGVICKDYVYYEGNIIHPNNVVIKWDGSTGFDANTMKIEDAIDKSPFHIVGYNDKQCHTSIRGFKFDCNDIRYPIHVETQGHGLGVEWVISDCDFTGYSGRTVLIANGNNGSQGMPSIGMGSTCNEVGEICRCKFPARPSESLSLGIVNHDNNPSGEYTGSKFGVYYNIHDCNFNGNDILVRSFHDIQYDTPNQIKLSNCSNIKRLYHSENTGVENNWVRSLNNCSPEQDDFN